MLRLRTQFLTTVTSRSTSTGSSGEIYYFKTSEYEIDAVVPSLRVEVKSGKAGGSYPKDVLVLGGNDVSYFLHEIKVQLGCGV